jgi:hypothetical protein
MKMDLLIIPVIAALLLVTFLIYRGYAARAWGRRTPDQET